MIQSQHNTKGILVFLWVLFVLVCYYPYEFRSMYFLFLPDKVHYSLAFFCVFSAILGLIVRESSVSFPRILWTGVAMQAFGFFLVIIAQGRSITAFVDSYMPLITALVLLVFIECTSGMRDFFSKYNKWICLMAVLGIITWGLVYFANYKPLYFVVERGNSDCILYNYITTFTKSDELSGYAFRFSGFFDEPGAIAYWGTYMLLFNQMFYKNKIVEWASILSLLFTFSAGFYIQLMVYFLFFKTDGVKNILFTLCIIVILFFALSQTKGTQYDFIYEMTVERFENMFTTADESNSLAVDNRENYTLNAKRQFHEHPLFGAPDDKQNRVFDNIYEPLAKYGIIGTFFIYAPFILLLVNAFKKNDRNLLKAVLIMIIGFTHRPFHNFLLYYFILYGFIILYNNYGVLQEQTNEEN